MKKLNLNQTTTELINLMSYLKEEREITRNVVSDSELNAIENAVDILIQVKNIVE